MRLYCGASHLVGRGGGGGVSGIPLTPPSHSLPAATNLLAALLLLAVVMLYYLLAALASLPAATNLRFLSFCSRGLFQ
jgi:hypothetical protein